jgi:hypothetical protein
MEREWINLQEALIYMFGPWIQLGLGFMFGMSIIGSVTMMFMRIAKTLTNVEE